MKGRGDDFGTVAVGVPYAEGRGHYEFFRSFCWLLIEGGEEGDYFLNTERVRGDYPLPHLHNDLVREFLAETDADTLCLVEDDHVFDSDALRRLRTKPENYGFDVVVASYVARRGQPIPVSWHMIDPQENDGYNIQFRLKEVAQTGTQEYDGSGLGLCLIRRWVLEEILGNRDPQGFQWFWWDGVSSPDVGFYRDARALGARVGVDRDVRIGHIGQRIWRFEDFLSAIKEKEE